MRTARSALVLALTFALAACGSEPTGLDSTSGGGDGERTPPPSLDRTTTNHPVVDSISRDPADTVPQTGVTFEATATPFDSLGSVVDTAVLAWATTNEAIVTVAGDDRTATIETHGQGRAGVAVWAGSGEETTIRHITVTAWDPVGDDTSDPKIDAFQADNDTISAGEQATYRIEARDSGSGIEKGNLIVGDESGEDIFICIVSNKPSEGTANDGVWHCGVPADRLPGPGRYPINEILLHDRGGNGVTLDHDDLVDRGMDSAVVVN